MNCFTIPDSMYAANLLLAVNCTKDIMLTAVERHCQVERQSVAINDTAAAALYSITDKNKKPVYVIWIEKYDGSILSESNLAHETLHFVNWLLDDRGIKFHLDSDDVQCYYFGHIFGNCLTTLKKLKAKGKKCKGNS